LSNLKRFPIDTIKVDRSFIRELPTNAEDGAITEAIIAMSKSLKMTVVAEGVETEGQIKFLRNHECDEFQGFYFSKAVPPAEIADFLRTQPWATSDHDRRDDPGRRARIFQNRQSRRLVRAQRLQLESEARR
jgi:EAL domain-containing protein (putative c-di-GMP-specific phosphodiesterase class I)